MTSSFPGSIFGCCNSFSFSFFFSFPQKTPVRNNPHTGFCWFGHLSSGVDPVVSSHTWPSGHFTGCKKIKTKQQTEGRRKKLTNTHSELQNAGMWSWHFVCICYVWLLLPKMLTHLVIVFTALCLCSLLHTTLRLLWTYVLDPTDQPRILGLNL